ncbi:hypothetical protein AB0M29_32890 [Streptomyces sp. NPDC051976]|uniref:hypothetical protein n=1 Tax=Streptomyces sp. NPDC051976 TaxID=3154947 RepID=UPI003436A333
MGTEPKEYAVGTERDEEKADRTEHAAERNDADRPARRSRLTIVAVAVAVLLAGGGGAIWAANGTGGGSGGSPSAHPAPLRMDDGTAPVEGSGGGPASTVGGPAYKLTGTLPGGPKAAPVYRPDGQVDSAAVTRLASLLGVKGSVVSDHDSWRVGGTADGSGPELLVSKSGPGTWSYTHYGPNTSVREDAGPPATDVKPGSVPGAPPAGVERPMSGGSGGSAPGASSSDSTSSSVNAGGTSTITSSDTPPVSESRAKAAAAPVLAGLGLSGAHVDATRTAGAIRTVSADPVVGGLPTHGWATSLQIGSDGTIALGYGRLATLAKGDTYPVVSAAQAFKDLNADVMHPDNIIYYCPMQPPLPKPKASPTGSGDDKTLPHSMPCSPGNGNPVEVRGAVFGLALEFVSGTQSLVPAWLFDTAQAGVRGTDTVAQTAVDPKYIQRTGPVAPSPIQPGTPAQPASPAPSTGPEHPVDPLPPRPVRADSYHASGSTLTVTFTGGLCSNYTVTAQETDSQVRVSILSREKKPGMMCPMIAKVFSQTVQLKKPLGDRKVVDAADGQTLLAR